MNGLASFIAGLDLAPLYTIIQGLAKDVATYISPTLLIIAIYTRTMETQLDGLVSGGKWAAAIRDMVGWGVVLGLYGAIGYYVIDFMNSIYSWSESKGSLDTLMKTFSDIMQKSSERLTKDGMSFTDYLASPIVIITGLAYYLTLIVATFAATFLKIANVLIYGVAYIWGLIAIPMSITTTFRILRGWGLIMGMALLWPFIQALLLTVFTELFKNAANVIVVDPDLSGAVAVSNIYMLFSVMHLLLIAVLIASPLIAQALVANAPAAAGIVTPFVGAAIAAGALTAKASEKAGGAVGGRIKEFMTGVSSSVASEPTSRAGTRQLFAGSPSASSGTATSAASDSVEDTNAPANVTAPADTGVGEKMRQRRDKRNAIIKQQLKRR